MSRTLTRYAAPAVALAVLGAALTSCMGGASADRDSAAPDTVAPAPATSDSPASQETLAPPTPVTPTATPAVTPRANRPATATPSPSTATPTGTPTATPKPPAVTTSPPTATLPAAPRPVTTSRPPAPTATRPPAPRPVITTRPPAPRPVTTTRPPAPAPTRPPVAAPAYQAPTVTYRSSTCTKTGTSGAADVYTVTDYWTATGGTYTDLGSQNRRLDVDVYGGTRTFSFVSTITTGNAPEDSIALMAQSVSRIGDAERPDRWRTLQAEQPISLSC